MTEKIYSEIITSKLVSPDDYKYPSEIYFTPQNNMFRQNDYVSMINVQMKDLYQSSGQLIIDDQIIKFDGNIETYQDVIFIINLQTTSIEFKTIMINQNFSHFQYKNLGLFAFEIKCSGNLRNILGIHNDIQVEVSNDWFDLSKDNSLRIQYIKIQCPNFYSSMQYQILNNSTNTYKTEFEESTLIVLNKSNHFQHPNKNLDVHHLIKQNPPFLIKIVDQDNRPVNLSQLIIQFQFYKKETLNFINESDFLNKEHSFIKGHSKEQIFVHLNNLQQEILLPKTISQISLSDASGSIDNILFTQQNALIGIHKFDVVNDLTFQELIDLQNNPETRYQQLVQYSNLHNVSYYKIINLYNNELFKDYRNKFIDYDFIKLFEHFLNSYFEDKIKFQFEHNEITNKYEFVSQLRCPELTEININVYKMYYIYYTIDLVVNNILFNILSVKQYSKLKDDKMLFSFGNTKYQYTTNNQQIQLVPHLDENDVLLYYNEILTVDQLKVDLSQMYCYSTLFYIYCDELDFDKLLGVIVGDNLNLIPLNKQIFCWKLAQKQTRNIRFRIVNYIENDENKLIQTESTNLPDMYLRLLLK